MQPVIHTNFSFAPPRYTYDDYKNWSDDWELIEGYAYSLMPAPKRKHQDFATNFNWATRNFFLNNKSDCKVYIEFDWIVNSETVVRPDCMIVCGAFTEDYVTAPPALIVEIGSPSTHMKDKNIKFKLYEINGVKYYLMADTERRKVTSYELIDGSYRLKADNKFLLDNGCEITLDFDRMWEQ